MTSQKLFISKKPNSHLIILMKAAFLGRFFLNRPLMSLEKECHFLHQSGGSCILCGRRKSIF